MTKCYHPRLIDLPIPKKTRNDEVFSLSVQEEDGSPDIANVQRLRFPNGALTNHGGGDVSVAGGSGAGTPHNVFFMISLPVLLVSPGPTNITGSSLTITASLFKSDGEVAGSLSPGGSFSFGAGGSGSPDRTDGLSINWPDGTELTINIDPDHIGLDGTYLAFTLAVI